MRTISFIAVAALAMTFGTATAGVDPGMPDTVRIGGGPLVVGQSTPLTITFFNDEDIAAYDLGLEISTLDSGFAQYDSIVYINRLADPSVMHFRFVRLVDIDGQSPDTIDIAGNVYLGYPVPVGDDPLMLVYFTGLTPGALSIDSTFVAPASPFIFVLTGSATPFHPQFVCPPIEIIQGHAAPEITLPAESPTTVIGNELAFGVSALSPAGFPVSLTLESFAGYDDDHLPVNSPLLSGGNPAWFSWTPAAEDVGIWKAVFRACDTSGICSDDEVVVQVVTDDAYLLTFAFHETPNINYAFVLKHGEFDEDMNPELFSAGIPRNSGPAYMLFDYPGQGGFAQAFAGPTDLVCLGLQPAFLNADDFLDVVMISYQTPPPTILTLHGTGDNDFTVYDNTVVAGYTRETTLGGFGGDDNLDLAAVWRYGVKIFTGDNAGHFTFLTELPIPDTGTTLSSADFNGDGYDDLAVGTKQGITIYLGNGAGNFTTGQFYSQAYGTLDIEVTNKGSDFNNDNIFDLCISTPSVAGEYSEMVVYLGNGDGTFVQNVIRTVRGQVYGNSVGDFNNDGQLDIAYINAARQYAAILFGDGDGLFTNELRFNIPLYTPQTLDCFDVDLDGDLDLAVTSHNLFVNSSIFLMTNDLDPAGFSARSVAIAACDNAAIELTSPSGKTFNRIHNALPSGDYYRRHLDQNASIDDYATLKTVETGRYELTVSPKPHLPAGEPFSVEFMLDGQPYRLAKDIPMNQDGYEFTIYLDDASPVLPCPGSFLTANPPTFIWSKKDIVDIQVASDVDFTDLVVNTTVTGDRYTPAEALLVTDTTTYYWRIKAHGTPDYDCRYAVNMLPGGADCGDANGDGLVGLADAVFMVNYIFKGGPAPDPYASGDANGNGTLEVGDAVYYINYTFRGGPPPNCP